MADPDVPAYGRPDDILMLPSNLKENIVAQFAYGHGSGPRFVVPIPQEQVL